MRYIKIPLITLVLCGSFLVTQAAVFTEDLYFGVNNSSQVTKLQEFLTDQNLYTGPITGNFFSLTLKAVKSFQTREGISPSAGYFGPITRAKANELLGNDITQSNNQAIAEVGGAPVEVPVQSQIDLLLQQVTLLQNQINAIQQTNQNIQSLQNRVDEQNQLLGQIQQNTTPPAPKEVLPLVRLSAAIVKRVYPTARDNRENLFEIHTIGKECEEGVSCGNSVNVPFHHDGNVLNIPKGEITCSQYNADRGCSPGEELRYARVLRIFGDVGNPDKNFTPKFTCQKSGNWTGSFEPFNHWQEGDLKSPHPLESVPGITLLPGEYRLTCTMPNGASSSAAFSIILPSDSNHEVVNRLQFR